MLQNLTLHSALLSPCIPQLAPNVFNDPLAQFEVLSFTMIKECAMFANVTAYLIITVLIIYCALVISAADQLNAFSFLTFLLHGLVKNIVKENLYIKIQIYYGNIFFLFLTLLILNVLGLLPYSFTATSSAIVTLFLSASHFVAINLIAVHKARWEVGSMFLPLGSPLAIIGLLIPIEFISYVARLFSLSVRLFANMLSGHALLKILIGFSWTILVSSTAYSIFFVIPWVIVTVFSFLELLISFLQAYVFTVLVTLYANDVTQAY